MRIKNSKLNKLVSKVINETLEEKADKIASKLKQDVNELGGMSPESQDTEHPFYNLNASKMSKSEMNALMKKYYGKENYLGDEEEENSTKDWEEIDIKGANDDEDEFDVEDEDEEYYDEEQESEKIDENWDSEEMKFHTHGEKYSPKKYKKMPLGKGEIGLDDEILDDNTGVDFKRRIFNDFKRAMRDREDYQGEFGDEEFAEGKGSMCECGGMIKEGECEECGYKMEGIYDVDDIDDENEFDYVEEDLEVDKDDDSKDDRTEKFCNTNSPDYDEYACEYHKKNFSSNKGEMTEKLHGGQRRLDKNRNGRLDAADFKMMRAMKGKKKETDEEVEEGNAFTGALAKAKEQGRDEFEVDGKKFDVTEGKSKSCKICGMKNCKCNHKKNIKEKQKVKGKTTDKETVKLTESQMIELIEKVILEQKQKLVNKGGQPKGLQKYKQSFEKSGKENKDYLNSVGKKMKDYLKDGSKGGFDMNPKKFPMGNGELGEMKKKAYQISKDGKEFLDRYQRPGMENLDYDEIHPNEEWMKDNIEGSSRTGNNPEWANAVETDVNKNINKKRESNEYAKAKRAAFQKAPQPVINDKTGDEDGTGIHLNLGKSDKKAKKVNEEFDRMKNLISYDRKTQ